MNADSLLGEVGGVTRHSLFTYCGNRPVCTIDIEGTDWLSAIGDWLSSTGEYFAAVWEGMSQRSATAWSNPNVYTVCNWLSMGTVEANYYRGQEAFSDSSLYNVGNYLTSGYFDTVKGAIAPEKAWSFDHLMCSFGVVATLTPAAVKMSEAIPPISKIGRMSGIKAPKGYLGIMYQDEMGFYHSLEIHSPHHGHGLHLQVNRWIFNHKKFPGEPYRLYAEWRKTIWGMKDLNK